MTTRASTNAHRLSAIDRAYFSGPAGNDTITGLYLDVGGSPPDLTTLRERLHRRMADTALPALALTASSRRTHWKPAPVDLDVHVRDIVEADDLDRAVESLLHRPLPSATRPLWDLWILTTPSRTEYRLCFRCHHGMLDGVGIAHTALALLADQTVPGPRAHHPHRPTLPAVARVCRERAAALRRGQGWDALSAPGDGTRSWRHADAAESRLRNIAARTGGTVNDVFLAATTCALQTWWHTTSSGTDDPDQPADLPVAMPMSVRRAGEETAPGNRTAFTRLRLPTSKPDPRAILSAITRDTRRLNRIRYRDTAWSLACLPALSPLVQAQMERAWQNPTVICSQVRFPSPFHCFGSTVSAAARLPVLAASTPCYLGLTRVAETARFAVVHNASLQHATDLPRMWLNALTKLEHAAGCGSQAETADSSA